MLSGKTHTNNHPSHKPMEDIALYIHFPYCRSRCTYCDFNAYVLPDDSSSIVYVEALLKELETLQDTFRVHTIFLGGGTPSLTPVKLLANLLEKCSQVFHLSTDLEITIEANPGTVDVTKLRAFKAIGINRLSLGVQAFQAHHLRRLNRIHSPQQAVSAVQDARKAGYDNINLDLIYGLPLQTLDEWLDTITTAINLQPEHLSLYQLSVETGTKLFYQVQRRLLSLPAEEQILAMEKLHTNLLPQHGYLRYEISNWSLPGYECRHNLMYWLNRPYLGLGCGAVSFLKGWRFKRIPHPGRYIKAVIQNQSPIQEAERLSSLNTLKDSVMLALRCNRGLDLTQLEHNFPGSYSAVKLFFNTLPPHWFTSRSNTYKLTSEGLNFWNEIYLRLLNSFFELNATNSKQESQ